MGQGEYRALLIRDRRDDPSALSIERAAVRRSESVSIEMSAGGGFIGRFNRNEARRY
jgi:alpha-glucosidase